jgi:hypothetical protein
VQSNKAKTMAMVDEKFGWAKDFDWNSVSRSCESQLALTQRLIASPGFSKDLDSVIMAAKAKLAPTLVLTSPSVKIC